jgi:murein DD-endopeptidase MepM/ murein hydrolase activator NlpD
VFAPDLRKNARPVAIGTLCGFLAGALTVSLIVWKGTPSETWLGAGARFLAERQRTDDRWDRGPVDDDAPVLESKVGTAGTDDGPEPTPSLSAPPAAELAERDFAMPVDGLTPDRLVRSFDDARGARRHEAIDILAPLGTPVRAIEGGRIARLFNSKAGGITIYQFDPTERFCYYYAHLQGYAPGLKENDVVRKGQLLGYVGVSGNAPKNTPHLHFAIFRLTTEKRWWEGIPVDPYDVLR